MLCTRCVFPVLVVLVCAFSPVCALPAPAATSARSSPVGGGMRAFGAVPGDHSAAVAHANSAALIAALLNANASASASAPATVRLSLSHAPCAACVCVYVCVCLSVCLSLCVSMCVCVWTHLLVHITLGCRWRLLPMRPTICCIRTYLTFIM
jgi:hypothetical protein